MLHQRHVRFACVDSDGAATRAMNVPLTVMHSSWISSAKMAEAPDHSVASASGDAAAAATTTPAMGATATGWF